MRREEKEKELETATLDNTEREREREERKERKRERERERRVKDRYSGEEKYLVKKCVTRLGEKGGGEKVKGRERCE